MCAKLLLLNLAQNSNICYISIYECDFASKTDRKRWGKVIEKECDCIQRGFKRIVIGRRTIQKENRIVYTNSLKESRSRKVENDPKRQMQRKGTTIRGIIAQSRKVDCSRLSTIDGDSSWRTRLSTTITSILCFRTYTVILSYCKWISITLYLVLQQLYILYNNIRDILILF